MAVGEVGNVAGTGCGYSGFYGCVWFLAGLYAVEEVLHVGVCAVAEAGFGEDGIFFAAHSLVVDGHAAAIDLECCIRAAEFDAAVVDGRGHHALIHHVESFAIGAGIAEGGLDGVGAIPIGEEVLIGKHLGVGGLVRLHGPVNDIDPVGEEVGHGTAAEVPKPAPVKEFFFAELLVRCGAEPHLPVEIGGVDGVVGRGPAGVFGVRRLVVLPPVCSDLEDASEVAALDEIDGAAEVRPTALLHAALQDLLAGSHGLGEGDAFFDGVGNWFFKIDIFASAKGVGGHANVPVVG